MVDYEIPGGRFDIEFYLNDGSVKRIVLQGGGHFYGGYPVNVTPTLDRDKYRSVDRSYSFVPYEKPTTLYVSTENGYVACSEIEPSIIEFRDCQSNCSVFLSTKYYFSASVGRVEIFDDNHMRLNGKIYEITNWSFANFDNILEIKKAYEAHYNDGRVAYVERYYGTTSGGGIAAMITDNYTDYTQAEWKETVGGYNFHYSYGNNIVILYQNEFYSLTQAYENGYITDADLYNIKKLN
jgi:hypothetical protein